MITISTNEEVTVVTVADPGFVIGEGHGRGSGRVPPPRRREEVLGAGATQIFLAKQRLETQSRWNNDTKLAKKLETVLAEIYCTKVMNTVKNVVTT